MKKISELETQGLKFEIPENDEDVPELCKAEPIYSYTQLRQDAIEDIKDMIEQGLEPKIEIMYSESLPVANPAEYTVRKRLAIIEYLKYKYDIKDSDLCGEQDQLEKEVPK